MRDHCCLGRLLLKSIRGGVLLQCNTHVIVKRPGTFSNLTLPPGPSFCMAGVLGVLESPGDSNVAISKFQHHSELVSLQPISTNESNPTVLREKPAVDSHSGTDVRVDVSCGMRRPKTWSATGGIRRCVYPY